MTGCLNIGTCIGKEHVVWGVLCLLCVGLLMIFPPPVKSMDVLTEESDNTFLGISGLIVDETRTVIGRNFFEALSAKWSSLSSSNDNILVQELADPRFGSVISISVADRLIFRRLMPPRLGEVETAVEIAIANLRQTFTEQERVQQELELY